MNESRDRELERFVIGKGWYTSERTAVPFFDDRCFRIDPAPVPVGVIWSLNLVFVAFFCGFSWLVGQQDGAGAFVVYGVPLMVGSMTCTVYTCMTLNSYRTDLALGPWLIYDKMTKRVSLPRCDMHCDLSEVIHVQYITTSRIEDSNSDPVSELNIVICRDGQRERWLLLRSIFTHKAFDYVLKPMVQETPLPVVRVKEAFFGKKITEQPYGVN